jgi:hypothetical protein
MNDECICGGLFRLAEDYRDHLPCPVLLKQKRMERMEALLTEILKDLNEIDFCCGYNGVIEGLREKIEKGLE